MTISPNALFHSDCLDLLKRLESESIDMIYLDPPLPTATTFQQTESSPADEAKPARRQLHFIASVCQHSHRLLKPTGGLFLQTYPRYAFSIRLILNQVFGEDHSLAETVWQYPKRSRHSTPGTEHEIIIHYGKSKSATNNRVFRPLTKAEIDEQFKMSDLGRRFALKDLTAPFPRPSLQYEWRGIKPPKGRSWRFNLETLQQLEADGRIYSPSKSAVPRLKIFLDENAGVDVGTIWTDIVPLSPASKESTRYPTQKPLGLLERLLQKGTNEGETVLDPFCGSGTTIIAAERLSRKWIGSDISKQAIEITTHRLIHEFEQHQSTQLFLSDQETLTSIPIQSASFKRVAVGMSDFSRILEPEFVLGRSVDIEEDRHVEFKEVKTETHAIERIVNTSDEYAVAFLNSEGGRLLWGIRDGDKKVIGVRLSHQQRDKIRKDVSAKLSQIEPRIDPSRYRLDIHEVRDEHGCDAPDMCVIELIVPPSDSWEPHYAGGNEAWIRVDGGNQKLKGPALTDFIKQRLKQGERKPPLQQAAIAHPNER